MLEKSPDAFKTISEAADELGIEQHVLRFWETKFTQIKPMKRRGGRRYYRPEDMEVLHKVKHLLYKEGYTISGAKKAMGQKAGNVLEFPFDNDETITPSKPAAIKKTPVTPQLDLLAAAPAEGLSKEQRQILTSALANLQDMRKRLQASA